MKAILLRSTDATSCNRRIDYLITAKKQISAAVEVLFDASTFSMINVCFLVLLNFRCMAVKVRFPPFVQFLAERCAAEVLVLYYVGHQRRFDSGSILPNTTRIEVFR